MSAKSSKFPLGPEDRWLIASVSTLAKLVEPVGPLAAVKRQWLMETRRLLKEASEFLTQKLPVGEVEYEELTAFTEPIEDTLLDLGVKLAGPETPEEAEVAEAGTESERNQSRSELAEAESKDEQEEAAEQPDDEAEPEDATDLPAEPAEEAAVPAEGGAEPAEEGAEPAEEVASGTTG